MILMPSLEDLAKLQKILDGNLQALQNTNSEFPEVKKFLVARGLVNVSQLDVKGRKELQDYLLDVYSRILNNQDKK